MVRDRPKVSRDELQLIAIGKKYVSHIRGLIEQWGGPVHGRLDHTDMVIKRLEWAIKGL
jgi:hypothetical protein